MLGPGSDLFDFMADKLYHFLQVGRLLDFLCVIM